MSLKNVNVKHRYDSDEDDIVNDFYIPIFSESNRYYRRSGFFSSSSLAVSARGLGEFIRRDGKMKLICNIHLSKLDYKSLKKALDNPSQFLEESNFGDDLNFIEDEIEKDHVEALGWMLANNYLEIKIAFPKEEIGTYHPKVGVFLDENDDYISFSGSENESYSGMVNNIEEFKVFRSWENDTEKEDAFGDLIKFEKEWVGDTNRTTVVALPEAIRDKIIKFAPHEKADLALLRKNYNYKFKKEPKSLPCREYQSKAVKNWFDNGCYGIFNMATGTGKTITALNCYNELKNQANNNFLTLIACPSQHLVSQWIDVIKQYYDSEILSTVHSDNWSDELKDLLANLKIGFSKFPIVLTTHSKFSDDDFLQIIKDRAKEVFLIVDEVHGVGASKYRKGLDEYNYRLGLSATPKRNFDDEGTNFLYDYFKGCVYKYSLKKAIKNGFLTPYCYCPHFVNLKGEELEEYLELTRKIAIIYENNKNFEDLSLTKEFKDRQAIIDNAVEKFSKLEEILSNKKNINHLLVYCTSKHKRNRPKQIDEVERILNNYDIIPLRFTGEEVISDRINIIQNFKSNDDNALIAMKCLDEGVDIPIAETGILMASTSNPREYVQRRGRLLRKYPGKEKAIIHDLIVLPSLKNLTKSERGIVEKELDRYRDFMECATSESFVYCNNKLIEWMDYNG